MQGVGRAHCHPYTPSSVTLCFYLRWLKHPSMPMEPLCIPPPCSLLPWGAVQELCPWEDGSLSRLSLLLGTLQVTGVPIPLIYHCHCLLGYAINRDKLECSSWSGKLYTCQVPHKSSASQKNITWGHVWLQGTRHSVHISPAKLSSACALLYDYLNAIQSTSNLNYLHIFACIL